MTETVQERLDSLVDRPLVRLWLYWGLFWLMFAPTIGVIISSYFNYPGYLGNSLELQFGRLRPMHVNGVIFGAFSTLFMGLCYYIVPRLCGIRVWQEKLGYWLAWVWNLGLVLGMILLAMGYNQGLEACEMPLLADSIFFVCVTLATIQFIVTVAKGTEPQLYVSIWYLVAAFVWTVLNLVLGSFILPYSIWGINSAAFHGLFIHYIVGLWITPAGFVIIYYFLPASVKNPIYSHKLSLIGFWSLALFYPFVGMLLIIPVWTVLQNFFGTMIGRWQTFGRNLTAKFLIMGALMYLIGCFQGSLEALRSLQEPTHFTDFVISHSHLTVFGTFVVWAIGGTVYVWPKIHDQELWSFKLGNWSFWLITFGISIMGIVLTMAGLMQGTMWMTGAEWLDSLVAMRPYWLIRTLAGISMDVGISLLVYNLMRTAMASYKGCQQNADLTRIKEAV